MKQIITSLLTGFILLGLAGTTQAECNLGENIHTEGPAYKCEKKRNISWKTKVEGIDSETFMTEGPRYAAYSQGLKTDVPASFFDGDFITEGMGYEEFYSDSERWSPKFVQCVKLDFCTLTTEDNHGHN